MGSKRQLTFETTQQIETCWVCWIVFGPDLTWARHRSDEARKTVAHLIDNPDRVEPSSLWQLHQAKIFLLAGLVTGSALLLHGLFMAKEFGWL